MAVNIPEPQCYDPDAPVSHEGPEIQRQNNLQRTIGEVGRDDLPHLLNDDKRMGSQRRSHCGNLFESSSVVAKLISKKIFASFEEMLAQATYSVLVDDMKVYGKEGRGGRWRRL